MFGRRTWRTYYKSQKEKERCTVVLTSEPRFLEISDFSFRLVKKGLTYKRSHLSSVLRFWRNFSNMSSYGKCLDGYESYYNNSVVVVYDPCLKTMRLQPFILVVVFESLYTPVTTFLLIQIEIIMWFKNNRLQQSSSTIISLWLVTITTSTYKSHYPSNDFTTFISFTLLMSSITTTIIFISTFFVVSTRPLQWITLHQISIGPHYTKVTTTFLTTVNEFVFNKSVFRYNYFAYCPLSNQK